MGNTHSPHYILGLGQLVMLSVGWLLTVGADLSTAIDPLHGGCCPQVNLLCPEAASTRINDNSVANYQLSLKQMTVTKSNEPLKLAFLCLSLSSGRVQ